MPVWIGKSQEVLPPVGGVTASCWLGEQAGRAELLFSKGVVERFRL